MEQITIFKICDLHMNNRQMIACQPNRESVLDNGKYFLLIYILNYLNFPFVFHRIFSSTKASEPNPSRRGRLRNYHRFGLNSVSKSAADAAEPGRSMDVVRF